MIHSRYNEVLATMKKIQSTAKVPSFEDKTKLVSYRPTITDAFAKSRNADELFHYWKEYRNATGAQIRDLYKEYIELTNKAAR